jgi:aspartyl-tRNA(Asn)/glutamyl-tRNA(Gln) amidotransferase subunit C
VAIDRAEVRRISVLAHLELDDAAIDSLTRDLESILAYVALLDELDVASVEPTPTAGDAAPALREDRVRPSVANSAALANAPDGSAGYFRVPRVLGE